MKSVLRRAVRSVLRDAEEAEREAMEREARREARALVLRAIKRHGWFWPGEDD